MSRLGEDYQRGLRRASWVPIIVAGVCVVVAWVPYIRAVLFHISTFTDGTPLSAFATRVYLWIGFAVTVLAVPVALFARARKLRLAARGVRTPGRPIKVSGIEAGGQRPVTFAYIVNGRKYTTTMDVPSSAALSYDRNTRVTITYDPENPGHCEVHDYYTPVDNVDESGEPEPITWRDFSDAGRYILIVVIFVVVFGGFLLIGKLAGIAATESYAVLAICASILASLGTHVVLLWRQGQQNPLVSNRAQIAVAVAAACVGIGALIYELGDHTVPPPAEPEWKAQMRQVQSAFGYQPITQPAPGAAATVATPSVKGEWVCSPADGPAAGQSLSFSSNGRGTITMPFGDAADSQTRAPIELTMLWRQTGGSVVLTVMGKPVGRTLPRGQMIQRFELDENGAILRHADGRVFVRRTE
jgi:hypothetical protein